MFPHFKAHLTKSDFSYLIQNKLSNIISSDISRLAKKYNAEYKLQSGTGITQ